MGIGSDFPAVVNVDHLVSVATIDELRELMEKARVELSQREYVCVHCGNEIRQALAKSHPDHKKTCSRYASMVTY